MKEQFEQLLLEAAKSWNIGVGSGPCFWLDEVKGKRRRIMFVDTYNPIAKFYSKEFFLVYELAVDCEIYEKFVQTIKQKNERNLIKIREEYLK